MISDKEFQRDLSQAIQQELRGLLSRFETSKETVIASSHLGNKNFRYVHAFQSSNKALPKIHTSLSFEEHNQLIKEKQSRISGLVLDNGGLSAHYGRSPSKGCVACKQNRWVTVFIGKACNLDCSFCPQAPKPAYGDPTDSFDVIATSFGKENYDELLVKLEHAVASRKIDAIGYSGGEPFMYIDRIVHYATTLHKTRSDLYQYVYTNGVLVDENNLQKLKAVGTKEVRFDLAATNFSKKSIAKMKLAKDWGFVVTVEVPALRGIAKKILSVSADLQEVGTHQINLCEVVVNEYNASFFQSEDCYLMNPYKNDDAGALYERIVPIRSRFETYELIEAVDSMRLPFVVNDCSQSVHYKPNLPF